MPEQYRALLIELLDYPRRRILQSMDKSLCGHGYFINEQDEQCLGCEQEMECRWINRNDEMVAVEKKPTAELQQQLLIAVDFIDASLSPYHLSRTQCRCENCLWLRKVQKRLAYGAKDLPSLT